MKTRRDGEATRESILKAASAVFGKKGFHKATHAEISRVAEVNTALINFHFRSKDDLYKAVYERAERDVERIYPITGGVPAEAPAPQRLHGFISSLLNRALDPRLEGFHRIMAMEMLNPTGLLDDVISQRRREHHNCMRGIIRGLLGQCADDRTVEYCEMSVFSQCHMALPRPARRCPKPYKHSDVNALTEHITTFSLAGVAAVRRRLEERVECSL